MHEVAIAQEIIEIVKGYLPKTNNVSVKSIKVDLGDFSNIMPDALKFGFEVLIQDSELKGALLELNHIPLKIRCNSCGTESELEEPFFYCPKCSSGSVVIITGTEMRVVEIELND